MWKLIPVLLTLCFISPAVVFAYSEGGYYSEATYYSQSYYQSYYQSNYYSEGSYGVTFTTPVTALQGVTVTGAVGKGGGSFVIDNPIDAFGKLLYHSFVESPDVKNIYDGIATLDANGEAVITLPDYFEALNQDFRYQVKPIDRPMPDLHVKEEVKNNQFSVSGGSPGGRISWQVTGIRHDPYILANPVVPEVKKGPNALVNIGEYVFPEGYKPQPVSFTSFFTSFASLSSFFQNATDFFGSLFKRQ